MLPWRISPNLTILMTLYLLNLLLITNVREFTGETLPDSDDDETDTESETAAEPGSDMSYCDILDLLTKLRNFSISKDSRYLQQTEQMISLTEDTIVKLKIATRQTTLDDFFEKPV